MRKLWTRRFLAGWLLLASLTITARADTNSLALMNMTGAISAYDGTGIKIGQLESGNPDTNNLAIRGQVVFTTNITTGVSWRPTAHATQVAGVMVSTNVNDPGVSPGATIYSAALSNANIQAIISSTYLLATGSNVRVINESFGSRVDSTIGTSVWERAIDALVDSTGVIFVQAAGNSGTVGANSIREPAGSYNAIVVGAVNNATPGTATNVAYYSSQGYLSNGRSAPDILAPGGGGTAASNVEMPTYPSGTPPTNTTFGSAGTSFATPHISGLVADLLEASTTHVPGVYLGYAQDSRTMKAVLLNSATQLPGWTQTGTTTNGAGLITITHPLDASQGAGLANGAKAYNQYFAGDQEVASYVGGRFGNGTTTNSPVNGLLNPLGWDFRASAFGLTNFYQQAQPSAGPLRITLAWNEDVADDATNTVLRLANLDLLLWSSPDNAFTNLTLVAQSVSTVDNLEQISLNTTSTNYYEFGIQYAGNTIATTANYQTNQFQFVDYGLAWDFTAVPEPSSLLLAVLGLGLLWRVNRKRSLR